MPKQPWTNDTIMPWGDHKGTRLEDVPADYLYWLRGHVWIVDYPGLLAYLNKNADTINEQAEELEGSRGDVEGYESYEDYRRDVRD